MKHYTKLRIVLRFICLLWGSVSLGMSESAPDDPFPYPPRKATVVDISKDKVFRLPLFFAHLSAYRSEGDGIAIYDANTRKVHRLQLPSELVFESEDALLYEHDSVQSIVEIKRIKKVAYSRDEDIEITGNHGHYKIELVP